MLRFLILFATLPLLACSPDAPPAPPAAPLFAARLLDSSGQMQALAAYRGQPLVVNFWARWCEPCRAEIPELQRLHTEKQASGLVVLGIGIEDEPEAVRRFAETYGMHYPTLLAGDKGNALMQALGNRQLALPYTIAIDRQGQIAASKLGLMRRSDAALLATAALR